MPEAGMDNLRGRRRSWVGRVFPNPRSVALLLLDLGVIACGLMLAYEIRFDGHVPAKYLGVLSRIMLAWVGVRIGWLLLHRFYRQAWQYASIREILMVLSATTAGTITLYATNLLLPLDGFTTRVPRSIFVIEWFLAVSFLGGSRFLIRLRHDNNRPNENPAHEFRAGDGKDHGGKRLLIVGAGDAGAVAMREINHATTWRVVGFIDDDPKKHGSRIAGIPVLGGRERIPATVESEQVDEILIAMPSASRETMREIVSLAQRTSRPIRTLPALHELIEGRVRVNQIREVQIEDLLGREPVHIDLKTVAEYLDGQIVLVTGAGGSIGSELCRQVARFSPKRLILLGHGENSVFEIEMELRTTFPLLAFDAIVADIQDSEKIRRIFAYYHPAVVFHAAAHKHVPLMERHPDEAAKNNVFGTLNVALAARDYGARKFVLISTDKAVNPVSVMGMTKRIAEMLIQSMNGGGQTEFMAVRFGNVLGSRGSVVPIFKRQIARGGPVTITHPEMTRYFMTIPEAVQLVIQAGALGRGHEVYVLDMGEPVKILDLAYNLIRLSGFEPGVDIKVEFTGIRPGEKLYEELMTAEEGTTATCHRRIFVAKPHGFDKELLLAEVAALESLVAQGDLEGVRAKLRQLVPNLADARLEVATSCDEDRCSGLAKD